MKVYTPKMLAKKYPHSVGYIRSHPDKFGLVKLGRLWVAYKKDVEKAHRACSTSSQRPDIGTLRSSIVDDSFESLLEKLLKDVRRPSRSNYVSSFRRSESDLSIRSKTQPSDG